MAWVLPSSRSVCLRCQLHSLIGSRRTFLSVATRSTRQRTDASERHRTGEGARRPRQRSLRTSPSRRDQQAAPTQSSPETGSAPLQFTDSPDASTLSSQQLEHLARSARNRYGDALPEGLLDDRTFNVYKRLYGPPTRLIPAEEVEEDQARELTSAVEDGGGTTLLRIDENGLLQEVEVDHQGDEMHPDERDAEEDETLDYSLVKTPRNDMTMGDYLAYQSTGYLEDAEQAELDDNAIIQDADADPEDELDMQYTRTHPVTLSGRWGTTPSTIQLSKTAFTNPIASIISNISRTHLIDTAQKALGGPGLPYSATSPRISKTMEQKTLGLSAFSERMKEIEADVYCATIMPQVNASVMSVLVEVRKRMGAKWMAELLNKPDGPQILDAGAGGAGVLAWREVLRAEWDSIHDDPSEASTYIKKEKPAVPYGKATVITASDALRTRASKLLENTTFIPRLPDFVDPTERDNKKQAQSRKQYDIVIASHALWRLEEHFQRKTMVETLWSLLNPDGGVLVLIEKGVPRGFEVIASARDQLLKRHISSPDVEAALQQAPKDIIDPAELAQPFKSSASLGRFISKEKGMIIAPCTSHVGCPLYKNPGLSRGRKDWCHFTQRFIRPPFLQTILGAKARNHDDVEFSYVAVMRGRDLRGTAKAFKDSAESDLPKEEKIVVQGTAGSDLAFEGYGAPLHAEGDTVLATQEHDSATAEIDASSEATTSDSPVDPPAPNPLSLPRLILTPLKRKGHILVDCCTPSGTIERWLVNRRCGRAVYRDARKSKWGDLWGLGAYSREAKRIQVGTPESATKGKKDKKSKGGMMKGRRWARKGKIAMKTKGEIKEVDEMVSAGKGSVGRGRSHGLSAAQVEELLYDEDYDEEAGEKSGR